MIALILVLGSLENKKEGYTSIKHLFKKKYVEDFSVVFMAIGAISIGIIYIKTLQK